MVIQKKHKLHEIVSKEAHRTQLTDVYCHDDVMVATNGVALARVKVINPFPDPVKLPASIIQQAVKGQKKQLGFAVIELVEGKAQLTVGTGEIIQHELPQDQEFVDYSKSVEKYLTSKTDDIVFQFAIDTNQLLSLSKALGESRLVLQFLKDGFKKEGSYPSPIAVKPYVPDEFDAKGVLMPLRLLEDQS